MCLDGHNLYLHHHQESRHDLKLQHLQVGTPIKVYKPVNPLYSMKILSISQWNQMPPAWLAARCLLKGKVSNYIDYGVYNETLAHV